jgi:hypothetical protein
MTEGMKGMYVAKLTLQVYVQVYLYRLLLMRFFVYLYFNNYVFSYSFLTDN